MNKLIYIFTIFLCMVAFGAPKEQDRAILEGSNRNILSNPGFEAKGSDWVKTGSSTLTMETGSPAAGKVTGIWDASATGEFLRSALIVIPEGLKGRSCALTFDYRFAGTPGDIEARVTDGTSTLVEGASISTSATVYRGMDPMLFTCPTTGSLQIEFESTADADAISLDAFQLGKMVSVSMGPHVTGGEVYVPGGDWSANGTYDGATRRVGDTLHGYLTWNAASTPSGAFTVELPPGLVIDESKLAGSLSGGDAHTVGVAYVFDSGTSNSCGVDVILSGTTALRVLDHAGVMDETMVCEDGTGFTFGLNDAVKMKFAVPIVDWDAGPSEAITLETVGEYWDVNIGGANPDLGLGNITAYTEINNASLDMVINAGSGTAEIPCVSGNSSTGLTCSAGNEVLGIVFDASTSGRYKVCAQFTHEKRIGNALSSGATATFQWVETANSSSTILQEGNGRIGNYSALLSGATSDYVESNATHLCGTFNLTAGQKTLRLMREQSVFGTVNSHTIWGDRGVSDGQRDINITVEKMDEQKPTPVFTDLQESLTKKIESIDIVNTYRVTSARIINSGTPTLSGTDPQAAFWIDSLTDNGVGSFGIEVTAGTFSEYPTCVCSTSGVANRLCHLATTPSTSTVPILTYNAATAATADVNIDVICIGRK